MSLTYQLSKLAEKDLETIWNYILENWLIKQADKYILQIVKQIEIICLNPKVGISISNIKKWTLRIYFKFLTTL